MDDQQPEQTPEQTPAVPSERTPEQTRQRVNQLALTIKNIQEIDRGVIGLMFNQALRTAAHDIVERPGDKAARKVILTIEMKPVLDAKSAALDTIAHKFTVDSKIPKQTSEEYPMLVTNDGVVVFQPMSPHDPRQMGFKYEGGEQVNKQTGEVTGDDASV
jgi:hypothetical protein